MASTTTSKQRLALAICDFLNTSLTDGTVSSEDKESIEIAVNCVSEAFKVDPADKAALSEAVGSQNLLQIYGVYEKLKSTTSAAAAASTAAPAAAAAATAAAAAASANPSEDDKKKAEELKGAGNRSMASKDYPSAIASYTEALALTPGNAIYLSNRAAAHSAARDHESARADAEAAVAVDPKYTKAWSRLGLARFALGDARGSMEAYKKGIDYEGNGGSEAMKKGYETAKRRVEELDAEEAGSDAPTSREGPGAGAGGGGMPDLSSLASMLGGGGGGGGGGGMPDFSQIMNNPMFANMAQNLMSNPDMMNNLMSNPRLRDMANQFSSGGGMPDMASLMSDPNIADMARNMMGGGGAGRGNGQ